MPVQVALKVAREIDDTQWRNSALVELAPRLPVEETLAIAGEIAEIGPRDSVLSAATQRLPIEKALAVVRTLDNDELRRLA
jgi:hypothetical protein